MTGRLGDGARELGRRIAAATGFGLIALFFSEFYFLNEGPVRDLLASLGRGPAETLAYLAWFGVLYAGFAYVALVLLWGPGGAGATGAILSGAILGWCIEAVVIPLAYEAPPLSFLWPSLGWHLTVVFGLGWIALRHALGTWRPLPLAALLAGLGLFWAIWAKVFWAEDPAMVLPDPWSFFAFALVSGAVWLFGSILADRPWARFRAGGGDTLAALVLAGPLFAMTGWPFGLWGAALGAMVALSLLALWRRRAAGAQGLPPQQPGPRYALTPLLPVTAALAFPAIPPMPAGLSFLVTLPLIAIGTTAWVWALWRGLRGR